MPCGFTTPLSCELRRLGFSLPLHCSALFNHGQVTPFIVYIAAFGRFMRRSRIPKHPCRHIYSRCEVRSCGAVARARTLGVNMLSENAFKEMPTLANRWSNFRFSSGIQVYFWMQHPDFLGATYLEIAHIPPPYASRGVSSSPCNPRRSVPECALS